MANISEYHASHIARVEVSFFLTARDLDPTEVSESIGLRADKMARRGDPRRNCKGEPITPHSEGLWMITTEGNVTSKDINDHIHFLLELLLPHRNTICELVARLKAETFFDVLWTSDYLYAGTGPQISSNALRGMSDLGASIGFDIYEEAVDSIPAKQPGSNLEND